MITLYLMSEKGLCVLSRLIEKGLVKNISQIVVGKDKAVINDYSNEIIKTAEANEINWCFQGEKIVSESGLAISWRWIIKKEECDSLYVLHDSLLPKYRGFAPLVTALINGEPYVGATLLKASKRYDEGNIVYQQKASITYPCKIQSAILIISEIYANLAINLVEALRDHAAIPSVLQRHEDATYSLWRDAFDYHINWASDAERIARFVDAVGFPYKGAHTLMNNNPVIIREANALPDIAIENRTSGKIIDIEAGKPVVVCGRGLLRIFEMEDENGSPLLPLVKFRTRFE
jgi:methionyl-tRNA formyltransferase